MSGIGLVLNVAKDALLTNQYAISVTSHNIANVSTEGYSRQMPMLNAKDATPYGGFLFGRGVKLNDIIRVTNDFVEKRIQLGKSDLTAMAEKETYMKVLESVFNENSSRSLSSQFDEFWNSWSDLANNPSGIPERNLLVERGKLLSNSFRDLSNDLTKIDREISLSIDASIGHINQLTAQIGNINRQITYAELSGNANDLRDQRNNLVNQLAEYIDLNTYENAQGQLTVTTSKGHILVNMGDAYPLGFNGRDIEWHSSDVSRIAITDVISGGKLGGWLDIRDEILPRYQADLNELARAVIWEVNSLHSQGTGLNALTSLTGTYSVADSSAGLGTANSGLDFYDRITDGSFRIWRYDSDGAVVGEETIAVYAGESLADLAGRIDSLAGINAMIRDGKLHMESDAGYSFTFSNDTSNVLTALGVNTFFVSANARDIGISGGITGNVNNIAAGKINNNVGPATGSANNTSAGIITTSGYYSGDTDAVYEIEIINAVQFQWRKDGGAWSAENMGDSVSIGSEGVTVTFTGDISTDYTAGDKFTISAEQSSDANGTFAAGDNTNALDITDIQYNRTNIKRWTFTRGEGGTSYDVSSSTINGYFHMMAGSIGIESQSIQREREFKSVIQDQMSTTRDNISAVSLDEEMANLIKFQHAYTAAAKLITASDEMLKTLLNTV